MIIDARLEIDPLPHLHDPIRIAQKNLSLAKSASVAGGIAEEFQAEGGVRAALERTAESDVAAAERDTGEDRVGL